MIIDDGVGDATTVHVRSIGRPVEVSITSSPLTRVSYRFWPSPGCTMPTPPNARESRCGVRSVTEYTISDMPEVPLAAGIHGNIEPYSGHWSMGPSGPSASCQG